MDITNIFGAAGGAAILLTGLLAALRKAGVPTRFIPLIGLTLGAILGIVVSSTGLVPDLALWQAIVSGVAVAGTSGGVVYAVPKELFKESPKVLHLKKED